jgi:glycosyltransferase involved in cell wall biosynthesis
MVKDEADIVAGTVGWMCDQVDLVIVADNGSTDATRELLRDLPVVLVDDPEEGYYQSRKMSALADRAMDEGAEWIVPFDADEVWLPQWGRIADVLALLPDEASVAHASVLDHVATGQDIGDSPIERMRFRRAEQLPLPKVAFRAHRGAVVHQGNHGVSLPGIRFPLVVTNQLQVRHFPYRSPEQMVRKARNGGKAYNATDLPEEVGKHWRDYNRLTDSQIHEVFYKWFWQENGDGLVEDPVPARCLSLL